MKKRSLQKRIQVAILTICGIMNAQAETLRGTVKDAVTGEALIGATVKILEADNAAAAGIIDGTPIYKKGEEFSERFDPTGVIDLTVSYKINKRRVSHTIAFEGLNILDSKASLYQRFDLGTRDVRNYESSISLPNIFYRLDF